VFPPSSIAHPWRSTLPVLGLAAAWTVALYYAVIFCGWLAVNVGSWSWSWSPLTG
jgi:hypothetical protein